MPTQLKTAIAPFKHHGRRVSAHILFDEGLQSSFVTSDLARQLDLVHVKEEIISLSAFGGSSTSVKRIKVTTIHVQTDNGEYSHRNNHCSDTPSISTESHVCRFAELATPAGTETSPPNLK